jgi:hypothetical protein
MKGIRGQRTASFQGLIISNLHEPARFGIDLRLGTHPCAQDNHATEKTPMRHLNHGLFHFPETPALVKRHANVDLKAPEDWRSPKAGAQLEPAANSRSVYDCASPLALKGINWAHS